MGNTAEASASSPVRTYEIISQPTLPWNYAGMTVGVPAKDVQQIRATSLERQDHYFVFFMGEDIQAIVDGRSVMMVRVVPPLEAPRA